MASQEHVLTTLLVSYNTVELLDPCLRDLRRAQAQLPGPCRIVVVDNASRDGSADWLRAHAPDVELIESGANLGFGRANNLALDRLAGPFVLLLNTDAFVPEDALRRSIAFMQDHPDVGIVGARLIGRDGVLQPSCRYFPTLWNQFVGRVGLNRLFPGVRMVDDMAWGHDQVRECDWVPGCYYLIRREVIDQVGLFDPKYFLYYEEVDHCMATKRAGWKVVFDPSVTVVHIGGESAKKDSELTATGRQVEVLQIESALIFFRKNHGRAGLAGTLLLESLAGLILIGKAALKALAGRGTPGVAGYQWRRLKSFWSLARRTAWGTRSTR